MVIFCIFMEHVVLLCYIYEYSVLCMMCFIVYFNSLLCFAYAVVCCHVISITVNSCLMDFSATLNTFDLCIAKIM